jgi:hypothetical protein
VGGDGWIKLFRQIQSNPLWTSEKFSRGQAWVDLLLSASHRRHKVLRADTVITVERGQVLTSQAALARRWRWNRKTVGRFLRGLEAAQMCRILRAIRGDIGHTLITITNYGTFQANPEDEAHSNAHSEGQSVPNQYPISTQHYKNGKNVKNGKRGGKRKAPPPNPYPFTVFWNRKAQSLNVEEPQKLIDHFEAWASQNGKSGVPIKAVLREAKPSFERHAIKEGYSGVSPNKLTTMFGKWVERDILKHSIGATDKPKEPKMYESLRRLSKDGGQIGDG